MQKYSQTPANDSGMEEMGVGLMKLMKGARMFSYYYFDNSDFWIVLS